MNRTVSRMLGEAADVEDPTIAQADQVPTEPADELGDYRNPSVEQLLQLWQSGNHEAVALRVLDALDHYEDFLELAFRIGHTGARELGRIMDDMTKEQVSPHEHDKVTDVDIQSKYRRPEPSNVPGAIGSPE